MLVESMVLSLLLQVTMVQGDNLSWLGYPEDTVPSTRATLLPGVIQVQPNLDKHV